MNNELLKQVIDTGQDFELYPTTDEIIGVLCRNTNEHSSILDIGAGTGKVLRKFKGNKYAMEKSRLLLDSLPSDVIIVGVDFDANTLIDKSVDIIFCNPPYSEYEKWAERIIKEANADDIYLVIPVRWSKNNAIINAIKNRNASSKVLGTFSFESSEDRKARATVNLVRIDLGDRSKYKYITPFAVFFEEKFGKIDTEKPLEYEVENQRKKVIETEVMKSGDLITTLIECYTADLKKMERNYTAITSLDSDILVNFNINLESLLRGLEEKMKGLKNLYWQQLFDRFDKVTHRLTCYARRAFLNKIFQNTSVDFTRQNIYAIAGWVIRNANLSLEDQIVEFYERMLEKANCLAYKSNHKVFNEQKWGWNGKREDGEDGIFTKLSNRILVSNGIRMGYSGDDDVVLTGDAVDYFNDLRVIAEQLGFSISTELMAGNAQDGYLFLKLNWRYDSYKQTALRGAKYRTYFEKNGKVHELYEVKMFKNGNIHIKFNQNFMNKINVIYGKLKGWISNPQDAENEMDINIKEATEHFNYDVPRIGNEILQLGLDCENK